MRRLVLLLAVSAIFAAMLMFAGPASAQGGCKVFGQTASGSAPLNDTVQQEQQAFCGS